MPSFHCQYLWLNNTLQSGLTIETSSNGIITEIRSASAAEPLIPGLTIPGMVNTHCHLELSHLQGRIPKGGGMISFLQEILRFKQEYPFSALAQKKAMHAMLKNGIIAVGDISNASNSFELKKECNSLYTHTFIELLGLNPDFSEGIFQSGTDLLNLARDNYQLPASLTPHAFYSVSPILLEKIQNESNLMSIHLMESTTERELFADRTGSFIDFFRQLGILDYLPDYRYGFIEQVLTKLLSRSLAKKILWVHNTFLLPEQILILTENFLNSYFCLCPLSNLYINQALPPVNSFDWRRVTLGTDSLASNDTLSILAEIQCLKSHFPSLKLEWLLNAATINGAKFLGVDHRAGELCVGKTPGIINIFPFDVARDIFPPEAQTKVLMPAYIA
jgi:cytosine/adenosine deaminase-related metal-dependent hydrolase